MADKKWSVLSGSLITVGMTGGGVAGGTGGAATCAAAGFMLAGPAGAALGFVAGLTLGAMGGTAGGYRLGRRVAQWAEKDGEEGQDDELERHVGGTEAKG